LDTLFYICADISLIVLYSQTREHRLTKYSLYTWLTFEKIAFSNLVNIKRYQHNLKRK